MNCYHCGTEMMWKSDAVSTDVECPKCGHSFRLIDSLDRLRNIGYKAFEIINPKDRDRSCWVSPDGKWYNVPFGDHQVFAYYVLKEKYPNALKDGHFNGNEGDILSNIGWIFFHHDIAFGTIFHIKHMTEKQYKVLLEFFGDERLMRGWTINALWAEHRGD